VSERRWRIRLAGAAEQDFADILQWTEETFGVRQAEIYRDVIVETLTSLTEGPDVFRAPRRATRYSPACARSTLDAPAAISWFIEPGSVTRSKLCVSCTMQWTSRATSRPKIQALKHHDANSGCLRE